MGPTYIKVLCVSTGATIKAGEIHEGYLKKVCCGEGWVIKGFYESRARECNFCKKIVVARGMFYKNKFIPLEDSELEAELIESLKELT